MSITTIQFTLRLFTALLLGAAVGLERQWRQRMANQKYWVQISPEKPASTRLAHEQNSAVAHFLEANFWTISEKANPPIGCCSGLPTEWRFHDSHPTLNFRAAPGWLS